MLAFTLWECLPSADVDKYVPPLPPAFVLFSASPPEALPSLSALRW
nr:MAG TPA: hypothetical protein [Caudoviricetes sp.]